MGGANCDPHWNALNIDFVSIIWTANNHPALRVLPGGNQVDGLPPAFNITLRAQDKISCSTSHFADTVLLFETRKIHSALRIISINFSDPISRGFLSSERRFVSSGSIVGVRT